MKQIIASIIFLFSCCLTATAGQQLLLGQLARINAGGVSCTKSALVCETTNDQTGSSTAPGNYQEVGQASTISICKIESKVYRFFADVDVKIEIWSDSAMAGTKYGESDADVTITEINPDGTLYSWDITTSTPIPGDFFVHFIQTDLGSGYMKMNNSTDTSHFGGASYTLFWNGADQTRDAYMAIWTE